MSTGRASGRVRGAVGSIAASLAGRWRAGRRRQRPTTTLTPDQAFDVLRNWRRRQLLTLIDEYEAMSIGELSDRIAAAEQGVPRDEVPTADRKKVYTALLQSHLPKLHEYRVVQCGSMEDHRGAGLDSGLVVRDEELPALVALLDDFESRMGCASGGDDS